MNVLYLNTHDIGRYLQTYGYPVETPNLLSLSGEGVAFCNLHCASPTCSPSRGVLLTGQYAHSNGLTGLSHRGFCIDGNHHLARFLKDNGYETVLSGVQHEVKLHEEETIGYERCLNPPEYYRNDMPQCDLYTWQDEMAAENAVEYLKNRDRDEKPFFLAVGFGCTHREYPRVPEDYEVDYVQVPKGIPNLPECREDMAGMLISVKTVDRLCGDILDALRESGEYDNTLIIFTTDHGLPFPMMKCTLYDDGTGVAFLIRCPGIRQGRVSDALLSHVDVFPTVCDLLGLEKPEWLQGISFLPVLRGACKEIREEVFAEINYHVAYEPVRCVRTRRYKYIRRWDNGFQTYPPTHMDDSLSKEVFRRYGYFEREMEREELYDLMLDPQERNNLAGEEAYRAVLDDMKHRLAVWQRTTGDPLLTAGRLDLPEGAICCTPDSYSTKTQVILPECRKYVGALRGILQNKIE